jgi:orotate phosphoribosyltransferase
LDITHLPDIIQEHRVQQQVHKTLIGLSCGVARSVSSRKLVFISVQEFMRDVNEWSLELPKDFDVVCAIPRTGLLAGTLLSQRWNVPLSTPEFLKNNLSWGASGVNESTETLTKGSFKRVLLVDDSVGSGETIVKAEKIIREGLGHDVDVKTAAVITSHQGKRKVNYFKRVIHGVDGVFEWSLPSRYKNWSIATDLDGVVCEDPPTEVLNNKTKYEQWLKQVKPLFVPLYPFTAIISGRLEKYRSETSNWLRNHGVRYGSLYLARSESDVLHKMTVLKKLKPRFYIESDRTLAEDIWKLTGIPTLCYKTMTMFS